MATQNPQFIGFAAEIIDGSYSGVVVVATAQGPFRIPTEQLFIVGSSVRPTPLPIYDKVIYQDTV